MFHRHHRRHGACAEAGEPGPGRRFARGLFGRLAAHHHRHHHGGRHARMFEHGDLRYLLLHMLSEQPRHGYELIRAIEDRMGGRYTPSPGAIYPTLTMLEEQGLATVTEDGAKKRYALTAEGLAFLAANKPQVEAILARIGDAGGPARPDPRILRAIENLHTALRLRHGQGPIEEARATAIAAAIDAAVAEIERT